MLELPATPRSRRATAGGCDVHVVEWGDGTRPPLLLLHGGMAHARWWDAMAARLADRLHVFAADLPGHGDSPWLEPPRYADVELAVIHDLIATLAPGPWALGGHSNGGLLAVVAATDGSPVERLVTVDIPSNPVTPQLLRSGKSFRRMPQPQWTSREEAMNAFRLFPRDGDAPPEVLRHVGWHSVRESPDGTWTSKFDWRYFRSRNAESPNPYLDFAARLTRIPCPTLVVRGALSSIQTTDEHAVLMSQIPQAHAVVIAGAGHNPHVERAAETAEAIARFLE